MAYICNNSNIWFDGLRNHFGATQPNLAGVRCGGDLDVPLTEVGCQQIAMAASLAKLYGFDSMGEIAVSMLKGQILSLMGRQLAASLTKFIPMLGQIINAGVAGAITGGLGLALVEVYERAIDGYLKTGKSPDWTKLLSSELFMQAFNTGLTKWKANKA